MEINRIFLGKKSSKVSALFTILWGYIFPYILQMFSDRKNCPILVVKMKNDEPDRNISIQIQMKVSEWKRGERKRANWKRKQKKTVLNQTKNRDCKMSVCLSACLLVLQYYEMCSTHINNPFFFRCPKIKSNDGRWLIEWAVEYVEESTS